MNVFVALRCRAHLGGSTWVSSTSVSGAGTQVGVADTACLSAALALETSVPVCVLLAWMAVGSDVHI